MRNQKNIIKLIVENDDDVNTGIGSEQNESMKKWQEN